MRGWRDLGACREEDPELFFPVGTQGPARDQIALARVVCRRCSVVDECLRWALAAGQAEGIWGGLTPEERRALRHRPADRGRDRESGGYFSRK
jgi:WhiB family redox-sensing transcriptional regulator